MLTILSGRAGSLWQPVAHKIAEAYSQGGEVVLLVPEQYTLSAERDMLDLLQVRKTDDYCPRRQADKGGVVLLRQCNQQARICRPGH